LTETGLVGRAWIRIGLPVAGVLFIGGFISWHRMRDRSYPSKRLAAYSPSSLSSR
jgi:hypothetical protein